MDTQRFVFRHVGPNADEVATMLSTIDASSIDELVAQTVPEAIRLHKPILLPDAISEHSFSKHISALGNGIASFLHLLDLATTKRFYLA